MRHVRCAGCGEDQGITGFAEVVAPPEEEEEGGEHGHRGWVC